MLLARLYLQSRMQCLCYALSSLVVTRPYAMLKTHAMRLVRLGCAPCAGSLVITQPYAILMLCFCSAGVFKALCYTCAMLVVRWYLQRLMLCACYAFSSLVFTTPYAMLVLCFLFAGIYKALCYAYAMLWCIHSTFPIPHCAPSPI